MFLTGGVVLGHHISCTWFKVYPMKIKVICKLLNPKNKKYVIFLAHARYYRSFTKTTSPLFIFLTKYNEFIWIDHCQNAFETLKENLSITPILWGKYWSLPFHISTDASDTTIGVVLGQKEDNQPYEIYFISKNLTLDELNYMVT